MAIDTTAKRFASLMFGRAYYAGARLPTGTDDEELRAIRLGLYYVIYVAPSGGSNPMFHVF